MSYFKRFNKLWGHIRFRVLVVGFILLTLIIGLIIVPIESAHPERRIQTFSDGVWWSVTTVTSVGYGDMYPLTPLGRTLGMVLMIVGVMMTGVILGFVTVTLFHSRDEYYWRRIAGRLDRIEDRIQSIEKNQVYLVKNSDIEDDSQ